MHFVFSADVNGFTSANILRLPGSPTQDGANSILSFYATLPSSGGTLARSVLATIFTEQQEKILSADSELQNANEGISSSQTQNLTSDQNANKVPITILNFESKKVSLKYKFMLRLIDPNNN